MAWRRKKKATAREAPPDGGAAPGRLQGDIAAQPAPDASAPKSALSTDDIVVTEEDSAAMGRSLIVPAGPTPRRIDLRADAPGWDRMTSPRNWGGSRRTRS
jgi:hypothetical protein